MVAHLPPVDVHLVVPQRGDLYGEPDGLEVVVNEVAVRHRKRLAQHRRLGPPAVNAAADELLRHSRQRSKQQAQYGT